MTRAIAIRPALARVGLAACCAGAAAFAAAGCASGDPFRPEQIRSDEAVIYIYRPRAAVSPGPIGVVVDQREVASLSPNEYVAVLVAPGEHLVRVQRRSSATRLVGIGDGQSAFLEAGASLLGGRVTLDSPGEAVARDRIASARSATGEPPPERAPAPDR